MTEFINLRNPVASGDDAGITVSGDWILANLRDIEDALDATPKQNRPITSSIGRLDTAGAQALDRLSQKMGRARIDSLQPGHKALLELVRGAKQDYPAEIGNTEPLAGMFIALGEKSVRAWEGTLDLLRFIGETVVTLGALLKAPKNIRMVSVIRHIKETGINAVPIVALIAFLISVVLAYQGAEQLKRFGAEIFMINMVTISVLREMGVLLTAIIIAGRSGSAFTAEIGVMKVNEEVDAMRIIGIRPFEFLVIPRLLALLITLPILTFIADIMGLLGGGIISATLLDISPEQYLGRLRGAVQLSDFWVGMIKAPVFAFFIAVVGCMRGMQVSGSAESVGKLTTTSVVQSIFLVLLMDALFSILFSTLGI